MDRYVKKAIRDLYRKQVDPKREADPALFEGILQNFNKAVDASVNSKKHGGFAHELHKYNNLDFSTNLNEFRRMFNLLRP